jgi:hypothetical protein
MPHPASTINLKSLSYQKKVGVFAPNNPTVPNLSPNMQKNALLPFYGTYNDLLNKSKNVNVNVNVCINQKVLKQRCPTPMLEVCS